MVQSLLIQAKVNWRVVYQMIHITAFNPVIVLTWYMTAMVKKSANDRYKNIIAEEVVLKKYVKHDIYPWPQNSENKDHTIAAHWAVAIQIMRETRVHPHELCMCFGMLRFVVAWYKFTHSFRGFVNDTRES